MVDGHYDIEKDQLFRNATMALLEEKDKILFDFCGEMIEKDIVPIELACKLCGSSAKKYFKTVEECQRTQKQDAKARGFKEVICPQQWEVADKIKKEIPELQKSDLKKEVIK